MTSIRLHPKHGVNPTMPICTWCGKPDGTIALLGNAYKGEAPMHMVVSDEPCATCKAGMAQGITIVEMDSDRPGGKRTGRWCVVTEDFVHRLGLASDLEASILEQRKVSMLPATCNFLGLFAQGEIG